MPASTNSKMVKQAQVVAGRARGHSLDDYFRAAGDQHGLMSAHMAASSTAISVPRSAERLEGGDGFPDAAEMDNYGRGDTRLESNADDDAISIPSDVEW